MMERLADEYGCGPRELLVSEGEARRRLDMILGDRIMRFNPYLVDDRRLVECALRGRWSPWPSLTQMVVIHFGELEYKITGVAGKTIAFRIGDDPEVNQMPVWRLLNQVTYLASLQTIRSQVNDRNITNIKMLENLQGKSYFVSHVLQSRSAGGSLTAAYRMYRLMGDIGKQADLIRRTMCEAKVKMLEEVLKYPYAQEYLRCSRTLFDYRTRILHAIDTIRHFADAAR